MRAILVVNPRATSTTQARRDVIARALASELDLEVVQTRYRGHASECAEAAARDGRRLVLTLGGDGTVNEVVNGLLRAQPPGCEGATAALRPALAPLPGGNANVFTRALGLPADPVDAAGRVLAALTRRRERLISVGLAADRYFTCNAGLGLDAEVVRAVEGLRADGQTASAALYVWTTARHFLTVTDRRTPALRVARDGQPSTDGLFLAIVSNASPWTYLGERPVNPSPLAGFGTGLDLFGLRSLSTFPFLNALRQMLGREARSPRGRQVVALHDEAAFAVSATRPVAFQVDGEYVGEREMVGFRAIPDALRIVA